MTEESGKINQLSQEIIKSLESSSTDGISKYISILLENESKPTTFDEYLNKLQQTLKSCTCKTSWNSDILLIKCLNCQKNSSSCVCAKCFLKGNHQGHKIIIFHGSCGCCDCGDPMCWSKSGFCSEHSGPESNPELTQLDSSTRIKLISISKSAFHYLQNFGSTNKQYFIHIIEFLTRLVSLGEAIRRCVCLSFCNSFDVIKFYTKSENFNSQDYEKIHGFFSILYL